MNNIDIFKLNNNIVRQNYFVKYVNKLLILKNKDI